MTLSMDLLRVRIPLNEFICQEQNLETVRADQLTARLDGQPRLVDFILFYQDTIELRRLVLAQEVTEIVDR